MEIAPRKKDEVTKVKPDYDKTILSEMSIIGAVFHSYKNKNTALINEIFESVKPSDFQIKEHISIFNLMVELYQSRVGIDPGIVSQKLKQDPLTANIHPEFIYSIESQTSGQIHENFTHHLEIVKNYGKLKEIKSAAKTIESLSLENGALSDSVLDSALTLIKSVERTAVVKNNLNADKILENLIEDIDKKFNAEEEESFYRTGFEELDDMSLIEGGDVVVLAGRPSMGKTTLALNICTNWARRFPVQVISMEMSSLSVTQTMAASLSKLDIKKLKTGKLQQEDWPKLNRSIRLISEMPIFICDDAHFTPGKLRTIIEKSVFESGVKAVMIDYFQLLKGDKEFFKKDEMYEHIMQELKAIAKDLDIVVLLLAQVNRECEKRPNKRPIAADLKGSSAIEQDASKIFFIYRDEVYNPDSDDKGTAEIISEKNRGGEKNFTVRLQTALEFGLFQNYSYEAIIEHY